SDEYEELMVQRALSAQRLRRDPSPAGKRVERVVIVNNDVVAESDLWPTWFNTFHVTTAPDVIERELLFKSGETWAQALVDESARNLRGNLYLATAQIVAAQGQSGGVVAVVVTKDLWSLRPDFAFSYVGSTLELLEAHPAENNLAGRNKRLGADLRLDLATYLVGLIYEDPRVYGSRFFWQQQTDLIWNKDSGKLEGGIASLSFGQPLYSLASEWSWSVALDYTKDVYRLFSGPDLFEFRTAAGDLVPYSFRRRVIQPSVRATRRYGAHFKHDLTVGWRGLLKKYELPETAAPLQAASIAELNDTILPFSEEAGIVFLTYHAFNPEFLRLMNIDTYGLTEDFRLGPDVTSSVGVASRAFGFSSSFIEPSLAARYLWYWGGDLFSIGASASARRQEGVLAGADWVNQLASVSATNISAPWWGGWRLHTTAHYTRRARDLNHNFETLGGDEALRGYPSRYFRGPQEWGANLEVRTRPYTWRATHFGFVGFVDTGDAFDHPKAIQVHTSVGVGLRVGVPQFNRPLLRFDFAYPLESIADAEPAYFVAQFGQAF
ncbi:MAG TPA: BamA/TamA family outer membrane protein, partial [Bdellovibrionota bacterium]|nr:BamA/TamA family outer membrane protein [Bdellovibrionota bacterium]